MNSDEFLRRAQSDPQFGLTQLMLDQTLVLGAIVRALMPRQRDQALAVAVHLEKEAARMSPTATIAQATVQGLAKSIRTESGNL